MHRPRDRSVLTAAWALAVLLVAAGPAAAAPAQTPAFDCAKARSGVEKQVCGDASLAALDRQLDRVFKAALAKASGPMRSTLRAEQRGWVKGRDDCWKATQQTWITASWTVDTVPACIDAQYRLRISELQAVWQLLPARTLRYACSSPADELVVRFFASQPATLRLDRGDRSKTLWQVGPPQAARYEGQNVSLVDQGSAVQLTWLDTDTGKTAALACKAR